MSVIRRATTRPGQAETADDRALRPVSATGTPLVRLSNVTKAYGATLANDDLSLSLARGEIVGLVGANGAGKSTLMRILCGVASPDEGLLEIAGKLVSIERYSPGAAKAAGIRIVYQELSLCSNLTVVENFYLEKPRVASLDPRWRMRLRRLALASIEAVFPRSGIDVDAVVGDLPIGQRQMVEIARAASDPRLALLILDEPTSSLDTERSADLRRYIRRRAAEGVGFVFISHKLREVLDVTSRVAVLRNGRLVWEGSASSASVPQLVAQMGGDIESVLEERGGERSTVADGEPLVRLPGEIAAALAGKVELRRGEIIGLAGLDGSGQKALLHRLHGDAGRKDGMLRRESTVSFVSGDRQREGVFPLWSVLANITIGELARRAFLSLISPARERSLAEPLAQRLGLDGRLNDGVLELSGGNQQKALVARALLTRADIVLLDDPTRGVDVGSKSEFYRLVRSLAAEGALVVWYSTEDVELLECDRVLVFHEGVVRRELVAGEISEEKIVNTSFLQEISGQPGARRDAEARPSVPLRERLFGVVPFVGLALIFATIAALNPNAASAFGIDLLLSSAVPLVLVTCAQMFVVGGSEIDLGVGAFAGLVNVVSATVLVERPWLGFGMLAGALLAYGAMGGLIHARKIPAIVVTLGASFIWFGCGYSLQATPGGSSPAWLTAAVNWSFFNLPTSAVFVVIAALIAWLIDRSRLGIVLRGFGNNPAALQQSGWSQLRFAALRYLIAGAFAGAAGLLLTAINTASDVNAGGSFTLLSIAAVVIGGCRLIGGVTGPLGVVCGAVTLSLIGALLGFLGISTDYNAAVQGGLLIGILTLRAAVSWGREEV